MTSAWPKGWSTVGVFRFWLGDGAGGLEAIERARAYAERAGSERLIRLTVQRTARPVRVGTGPDRRGGRDGRAGSSPRWRPWGATRTSSTQSLAVAHAMRGEIDARRRALRSMLCARARELGERLHLAAAHPQLEAGLLLGRYAETERVAREGIEQLREMGEHGYLATSLIYLADAIVSQDRPDEAETTLKEAEEHAAEDDAVTVIGIRRVRAKILGRQGRLDEAERHARGAVAAGERTDYLYEKGDLASGAGRDLAAKDERDEGLEQLRVALDLFERKGVLVLLGRRCSSSDRRGRSPVTEGLPSATPAPLGRDLDPHDLGRVKQREPEVAVGEHEQLIRVDRPLHRHLDAVRDLVRRRIDAHQERVPDRSRPTSRRRPRAGHRDRRSVSIVATTSFVDGSIR